MCRSVIRTSLAAQHYTREKIENAIRYFWQSRMVVNGIVPPLPVLTDIPALAQTIRRNKSAAWGR